MCFTLSVLFSMQLGSFVSILQFLCTYTTFIKHPAHLAACPNGGPSGPLLSHRGPDCGIQSCSLPPSLLPSLPPSLPASGIPTTPQLPCGLPATSHTHHCFPPSLTQPGSCQGKPHLWQLGSGLLWQRCPCKEGCMAHNDHKQSRANMYLAPLAPGCPVRPVL